MTDHFQRRADIIHRGFSGYNTRWAKSLLPSLVDKSNVPDTIFIFFGANDAAANLLQHVPVAEYKDNLVAMCCYLLDLGMSSSSIILLTPPPADEKAWAAISDVPGDCMFTRAQTYAHAVCEVAQSLGVRVINVFDAIAQKENWKEYLSDGLHLNSPGNNVVADKVIDVLEDHFEGHPYIVWPEWTALNDTNYQSLLRRAKL